MVSFYACPSSLPSPSTLCAFLSIPGDRFFFFFRDRVEFPATARLI